MDVRPPLRLLHRRYRHGWVPCGLLMFAGCATSSSRPADRVQRARQLYERGDYDGSVRLADAVIEADSPESEKAPALYLRGLGRLKLGQRQDARKDIARAARSVNDEAFAATLDVQMASFAFDEGKYAAAARLYERGLAHLPFDKLLDRTLYQLGVSQQRSGDFDAAAATFRRLIREHPESSRATMARRKLAWKNKHFSVQCGAFRSPDLARRAATRLHNAGLATTISQVPAQPSPFFVVHTGRYPDFESARAALPEVRRLQRDAFVVP